MSTLVSRNAYASSEVMGDEYKVELAVELSIFYESIILLKQNHIKFLYMIHYKLCFMKFLSLCFSSTCTSYHLLLGNKVEVQIFWAGPKKSNPANCLKF